MANRATSSGAQLRGVKDLRPSDVRAGRKQQSPTAADRVRLAEDYCAGKSLRALVADTGFAYGTVRNAVMAEGVSFRTRGGIPLARSVETKLGEATVAELVRRARNGEAPPDLADEFHVGVTAMYALLNRKGARQKGPRRVLHDAEVLRVYRLTDNGAEPMAIAAQFGVATATVERYLRLRLQETA